MSFRADATVNGWELAEQLLKKFEASFTFDAVKIQKHLQQ